MKRIWWKTTGLAMALSVVLVCSVEAQQHQQHHRRVTQMSTEQPAGTGTGALRQPQIMQNMQGMMESMQGMMEHMQGMMEHMQGMRGRGEMRGRGGMRGMMGRRGMMADDNDDDDDMPMGMRMRHRSWGGHMLGHGGRFMRHAERLFEHLELTGEQETKARSLLREHMKQAIHTHADIEVKRLELRELLDAEPVDLSKVKTLLQNISSQEVDLRMAHIALQQEIRNLLTPEQQETFRRMRHRMMDDDGGMMGRGGMRGPGGMRHPGGMMGRGPRNQ